MKESQVLFGKVREREPGSACAQAGQVWHLQHFGVSKQVSLQITPTSLVPSSYAEIYYFEYDCLTPIRLLSQNIISVWRPALRRRPKLARLASPLVD